MRSQTLLAQKPKRVERLANVGAKVRNKNETAKLFDNFLYTSKNLNGLRDYYGLRSINGLNAFNCLREIARYR